MAAGVGLLGCPQLLDDEFGTSRLSGPDAGLCLDSACAVSHSGIGGDGGSAGSAGTGGSDAGSSSWGSSGYGNNGYGNGGYGNNGYGNGGYGNWGNSGSAGSAGSSAGSAGSAGSSAGSAGSGSVSACRTFELTDTDHESSTNCIGVEGWNDVNPNSPSTLALSYQDGDACFTGTITTPGWGAVYNLTFAPDGDRWNATSNGVTGFEFTFSGNTPPASLKVIYKDSRPIDFCRFIAPGTVALPFTDAHPSCSTAASSDIVDATDMVELILAFVPGSNPPYSVDFCLKITALE